MTKQNETNKQKSRSPKKKKKQNKKTAMQNPMLFTFPKWFSHALEANVVPESRPGAELWPSERSEAEDDDEEGGGENGQGQLPLQFPYWELRFP
jgi:hypothetical protein